MWFCVYASPQRCESAVLCKQRVRPLSCYPSPLQLWSSLQTLCDSFGCASNERRSRFVLCVNPTTLFARVRWWDGMVSFELLLLFLWQCKSCMHTLCFLWSRTLPPHSLSAPALCCTHRKADLLTYHATHRFSRSAPNQISSIPLRPHYQVALSISKNQIQNLASFGKYNFRLVKVRVNFSTSRFPSAGKSVFCNLFPFYCIHDLYYLTCWNLGIASQKLVRFFCVRY